MRSALSIFGSDRPGIIASLTKKLAENGVNIEDASMTLLQGYFAMILVIDLNQADKNELEAALTSDGDLNGFTISFSDDLKNLTTDTSEREISKYIFHLSVNDTPGIVAKVTKVLAAHNSNVVDCATRKNNDTGVFTMVLDVDIPIDDEENIVEELSRATSEFSGDVVFQRVDDVDL